MYYWCEEDYKLITVQYHRAVLVGYLGQLCWTMNKLDLGTQSQNRTCLYVGDSLYKVRELPLCALHFVHPSSLFRPGFKNLFSVQSLTKPFSLRSV